MIGQRISSRRRFLKLTQEELAHRIGTSQKQISKYENEEQEPTAGVLYKLADVLETTSDWLLGRVDTPDTQVINDNDVYERVVRKMHQMNPDERKFLVRMIEGV